MEMIHILLTIVAILAGYVTHVYMKNKRFWQLIHTFKGDKTLPVIGNIHQFATNSVGILEVVTRMWESHGRSTYKAILGYDAFVMLNDPDTVEVLLNSNKELDKLYDYSFLIPWLGDGLLLSTGDKWRRQRKIITPTFHFKILEQFVSVFNNKGSIFVSKLSKNLGKVFDVYPYVTLCTLDVICETAMGTNINAQNESESEYVKAVYRMSELATYRTYSFWKRVSFFYRLSADYREEQKLLKILHGTTNRVIQSRKLALQDQISKENDLEKKINEDTFIGRQKVAFLDLLLLSKTPEGEPLSDEVVREEVDTFMFEGHDTTSSALSFAMYLLANNPVQQNSAFEEQYTLFSDDLERQPSYRDLQDMKYLERVIKETLRIYPAVPFFGRNLIDDLHLPDGKIIPAGTLVTLQPYFMHRNPKYFPDPLKFDPDRFLPNNLQKSHPFMFVPFSAGPRNCIGQKFAMLELKSTLSKVIRNFELYSAGEKFQPLLAAELILKSKNGINIQLKKRIYPSK